MSHGQALARNSLLQIGGKLFGTIFGLVTFYLLLYYFGTANFGLFTTGVTYVSIFAVLVDFGLTLTTTQMISEQGADERKILGNLFSLRLITAALFLTLAPLTAVFLPDSHNLLGIILLTAGNQFFIAVAQMFVGVFQKRLAMLAVVTGETANRLIALIGIIVTGSLGGTITYAALAFLLGGIAQCTIILLGTARHVHLKPQIDLQIWKRIVSLSWPIGVSIFFNLLYLKGDIFFMWTLGRTAEEIGQYGSAYKVVDVMTMIPITFMGLLLPLLSTAWSKKDLQAFKGLLQQGFEVMSLIAIPFVFGALALGLPIMTAVKPDLVLAGRVLHVLGPAAGVVFFGALYGHAIVALNKQKMMTWGYVIVAIFAIIGYVLFIPSYGAWAAAWVTLCSELLITLLTGTVVTVTAKFLPQLKTTLQAILASVFMVIAVLIIPTPHVFVSVVLGCLAYVLTLGLIGGPKPQDLIKLMRSPGQKVVS